MGSPLDDTDESAADLTDAETYGETGDRPLAGGRWFIPRADPNTGQQPDVVYQRPNGKYSYRSMLTAHDLRTTPTFTRLDTPAPE